MNDTFRRISYKCTERNEDDFLMFYILRDLFANKINSVLIFFKSQKTLIGFDLYSIINSGKKILPKFTFKSLPN